LATLGRARGIGALSEYRSNVFPGRLVPLEGFWGAEHGATVFVSPGDLQAVSKAIWPDPNIVRFEISGQWRSSVAVPTTSA